MYHFLEDYYDDYFHVERISETIQVVNRFSKRENSPKSKEENPKRKKN